MCLRLIFWNKIGSYSPSKFGGLVVTPVVARIRISVYEKGDMIKINCSKVFHLLKREPFNSHNYLRRLMFEHHLEHIKILSVYNVIENNNSAVRRFIQSI